MELPGILEGTWEEIRSHDAELSGHRVRIIILDVEPQTEHVTGESPNGRPRKVSFADLSGSISQQVADEMEAAIREGPGRVDPNAW